MGTQWLCTLGNIEYDFSKLLIKFELYDTIIILQGLKSTEDTVVGDQEIHKLTLTKGVLLKLVPMGKKGEVQQEFHPQVQLILQKFSRVLAEPTFQASM